MSRPDYVELHARSAFSFLRGACLPEEYVAIARASGQDCMALTDVDGVYGSARFHGSATKNELRAHVGAEITTTNQGRCTVLVKSRTGYQNLCRLITRMKLRVGTKNPKPGGEAAATPEDLEEFSEGLICLTGGEEGPLAHGLAQNAGRETWNACIDLWAGQRLCRAAAPPRSRRRKAKSDSDRDRAQPALPVVATNGVCHASKAQREILDVFTCLRNKTTLAEAGRLLQRNSERHLKRAAAMARTVCDLPEAIANTRDRFLAPGNSPWKTSATSFRVTRCRREKPSIVALEADG